MAFNKYVANAHFEKAGVIGDELPDLVLMVVDDGKPIASVRRGSKAGEF